MADNGVSEVVFNYVDNIKSFGGDKENPKIDTKEEYKMLGDFLAKNFTIFNILFFIL